MEPGEERPGAVVGARLPWSMLGCASWAFQALPLEGAARVVAALGFRWIDVGFSHLPLVPGDSGTSPVESGERTRRLLGRCGLRVSDVFPAMPHELSTLEEGQRRDNKQFFERVLAFTVELGGPGVTLKAPAPPLVGGLSAEPADPRDAPGWRAAVDALNEFLAVARQAGLRLSVEPSLDSMLVPPARTSLMLHEVPGLALTLDYTHFVARHVPQAEVDALLPHASHFHLRQARPGRVQVPARDGIIDYRRVLEKLLSVGYCGVISLEYQCTEWERCNDLDVITEIAATLAELDIAGLPHLDGSSGSGSP